MMPDISRSQPITQGRPPLRLQASSVRTRKKLPGRNLSEIHHTQFSGAARATMAGTLESGGTDKKSGAS